MYGRIREVVVSAYKAHPRGTVLFVSHSIAFRFFQAAVRGKPVSYSIRARYIDNDEIMVFDVRMRNGRFSARLLRGESHMHPTPTRMKC